MPSNEDLQRQVSAISGRVDTLGLAIRGSSVGSTVFGGGLPRIPTRDALPTPSADFGYVHLVVLGPPDVEYVCLRDSMGDWEWVLVATGT